MSPPDILSEFLHHPYWGKPTGEEHCEMAYTMTPYLAEFWSCMSSLIFVFLGIFGWYTTRRARIGKEDWRKEYEPRFEVLFGGFIVAWIFSFLSHATLNYSMERFDEVMYNGVLTLMIYLSYEDLFILIFYQLHVITLSVLICMYPVIFHMHMVLLMIVSVWRIWQLLSEFNIQWETMPMSLYIVAITTASISVVLWIFERSHCHAFPLHILPSLHSQCQFFAGISFYCAILLVAVGRAQFRDYPERTKVYEWRIKLLSLICPLPYISRRSLNKKNA